MRERGQGGRDSDKRNAKPVYHYSEEAGFTGGVELEPIAIIDSDDKEKLELEALEEPIIGHWGNRHSGNGAEESKPEREPIPEHIEQFIEKLETEVGYKKSFDVVVREMTFGEKRTALFFLNGFAKDQVLTEVLKRLSYLQSDDLSPDALHSFLDLYVPAVQVMQECDWNNMMAGVLAGASALYIDGENSLLMIDAKSFPARSPEEPSLERVVRGSRDGFVETMLVNVTLVRRRLRDKHLRYETMRVGDRTQTDVCLAYIDDIADMEMLEAIRDKIKQVKLDGLPLADKQLEEATVKRGWNPFPLVRYSERPDVVAAHLMEGHIAVFVDTSPSVMILPTTFFDLVQHAEENRQTPFLGTYFRWVRFFGIFASLFLLPVWFLFTLQPELKPAALEFIGVQKEAKIPLVAQFLLAEIGVDLMRMAAVHTPAPLATAMSLIAAILIGDIAVETGLFVNEVILYMAVAAIGMFATPSYELGLANRIVRLLLIISVAFFRVPGFMITSTAVFIILVLMRSFNRPYMWPFIPFDVKGLWSIFIRPPVLYNRTRPNLLKPQQRNRMPEANKE
ncbi:spore germination protein [Paenibacillus sp. sptzw28]|uniref:spore germination protein n=1 Tax=Paenibacillus sp. sptzw28 TaxID=715179 RepID=UPI001C6EECB4|nr:spore germination protein [Paenibacillus sp. sptzw28]QYR19962.1 spore germination protein [Paenibacillus sp. sptzw28]